jgi:hypothetical protein
VAQGRNRLPPVGKAPVAEMKSQAAGTKIHLS